MSIATLKIGKRDFVVVPKREFERVQQENAQYRRQQQEDSEDLAIIRKRANEVIRPYSELRKELGLK
ncbi:MAG: hypothetical protein ABSH20_10030 [Tepidisphaeraceae bacterium]|jgi:hypothetical protein